MFPPELIFQQNGPPGTYLTEKIGPPLKFLGHLVKTSYVSKLNKIKLLKCKTETK